VEWNKDDQDDITNQVNPPIAKKYNSYRQNNCPVESECCSYHDILTVHDASRNDSGVYTCLAWPVVGGTPREATCLFMCVSWIPHTSHDYHDPIRDLPCKLNVVSIQGCPGLVPRPFIQLYGVGLGPRPRLGTSLDVVL